jgi:hypothetical protein
LIVLIGVMNLAASAVVPACKIFNDKLLNSLKIFEVSELNALWNVAILA